MDCSRRDFLAAATAAAAASPFAVRAQAATKVKFVLDWRFEGPAALFLVGNRVGHSAREKLDATIDVGSGSVAAIQRVAAFGIKTPVSPDGLFGSSFPPPAGARSI